MSRKLRLRDIYSQPMTNLRAYLLRVKLGYKADIRTPLFKKQKRSKVLARWMDKLKEFGMPEKYPGMFDYELDMMSKVGPMSYMKPIDERLDSIDEYWTSCQLDSQPVKPEAIEATKQFFSRAGGIRLKDRKRTVESMKLSTNGGAPYFTKRKWVVEETLKGVITGDTQTIDGATYTLAATLGWRGQEGGPTVDDQKQRVVWMFPFLLNIYELQFYQPLIAGLQKWKLIPAYVSMELVDQEITALFDTKGPDDYVVETDFKAFDQHHNKDMQSAAREVLQSLCTDHDHEWFDTIFPLKYQIPLVVQPDLIADYGDHGMGSGSGGTNPDECMSHKTLQFEAALEHGAKLNVHSQAYGDDGILSYPGIQVEHIVECYSRHGQVMNPSKQHASKTDCVYLRRYHHVDYRVNGVMVGVYATFRALGRLMSQERFYDPKKWGPKMVELRNLSIIENCKWHPYFHQFIDFVMDEGDIYHLGLDIPGFFDNLADEAKKANELITDFLGYTKTNMLDAGGINDWEVVKYVKSRRRAK